MRADDENLTWVRANCAWRTPLPPNWGLAAKNMSRPPFALGWLEAEVDWAGAVAVFPAEGQGESERQGFCLCC